MDRLKGLFSFALITAGVLLALRVIHVAVPAVFPGTRQGPITVTSLDEVRRLAGFQAMLPAYRPATLGNQPISMTVVLSPRPVFTVVWRDGGQYLSVIQRRGGAMPSRPPLSQPLRDVPESTWWADRSGSHLILARDEFWIEIATSLPPSELRRFADTLTRY